LYLIRALNAGADGFAKWFVEEQLDENVNHKTDDDHDETINGNLGSKRTRWLQRLAHRLAARPKRY